MGRAEYARRYGPTTGDRIRLADTELWVEVEADDTEPGEELLGGCGKTARHGALVESVADRSSALDMIVLGVVLLDPLMGIRKTNIGIKDGRVVGVGRAGNPDVLDGVQLEVDAHTAMITGEGLLATPGIVDSHVHLSNADLAAAALSAGVTTIVGMGIGGVWDVGANPRHNLHSLITGWADMPINAAFLARGSSTSAALLEEAVLAGCAGFKVHEDWGATPDVIDTCLGVAEAADLPVALHTDTLNESGYLADTLDAVADRTVHAYHVEGGGGHPDLLSIVSRPERPHQLDDADAAAHPVHGGRAAPDDAHRAPRARTRPERRGDRRQPHPRARDLGRELAARPGRHQHRQLRRAGHGPHRRDRAAHLAARIRAGRPGRGDRPGRRQQRAGAALPGQAHAQPGGRARDRRARGVDPAGLLADIVLWNPAWFGAQPDLVIKSGFVAWGAAGSGSGSTRLTQPRRMRAFYGGHGAAPARLAHVFVAQNADASALPPGRMYSPIADSRGLTCADMLHNTATPQVEVAPEPVPVCVDGRAIPLHRSSSLPLTRLHHLG